MLKIKLTQTGRKRARSFRVVVQPDREKREGKVVELLGTFRPKPRPALKVNRERVDYWIKKGARPTETVARLLEPEK